MSRPKTNNYFTDPCRMALLIPNESSFEGVVKALRLSPEQYAASDELRTWVERNKDVKYVPLELLAVFGLTVQA